jgi:hypothetical protein
MISLAIYAVKGWLGTIAAGAPTPAAQPDGTNAVQGAAMPLPPLTENRRPAAVI